MHKLLLIACALISLIFAGCGNDDVEIDRSKQPDLAFASAITYNPPSPTASDIVTVTATISNIGGVDAGGFRWDAARDGISGFRSGTVAALASGASTTISFTMQETGGGTHTYRVVLDADSVVHEADETNNQRSLTLSYSGSATDLQIAAISVIAPETPTTTDDITLQVTYAASGTSASNVPWRISRDGVDGFASGVISTLEPGSPVTVTTDIHTETSGTHTYRATIDPDATILDDNRGNNTAEVSITVAPVGSG